MYGYSVPGASFNIPSTASAASAVGSAAAAVGSAASAVGSAAAGAFNSVAPAALQVVIPAVAAVLLDPTSPRETEEDAMLKNLMPPDSPQKIEEGTYPFSGGQSKGVLYLVSWVRTWEHFDNSLQEWILKTEYTKSGVEGPINAFIIQEDLRTYKFIFKWGESNAEQLAGFLEKPNKDRNPTAKVLSIGRIDGLPDTTGNPPPITQPIYTTNITNNYTIIPPPIVGSSNPPSNAAPQKIIPMNAGGAPTVASAPPPQIVIPELQPDIPRLISPLPAPTQTAPDIASSPPSSSYPTVAKTPSTGITAQQAEQTKYNNTQITPSTGVAPANPTAQTQTQVAPPVPQTGIEPNVSNPERTPQFSTSTQTQTATNSESSIDKLLEIEQALIRLRIAISSLQPSSTATGITQDIERFERDVATLRGSAATSSVQTTANTLERIKNQIAATQQRIISLNPSAQASLANTQRIQIERLIDQEITRLRNPSSSTQQQAQPTTETQTQTPTQTQTNNDIQQLRDLLTNLGLGITAVAPQIQQAVNNTARNNLTAAAAEGVCNTLRPGGCMAGVANNAQSAANNSLTGNDLLNRILNIIRGANEALIPSIWQRVQTIDAKLGAQMPGGLGGVLSRLSSSLGIDRVFNLINFMANLHNASMLSASLKVTLLGMLSSVGNATGLLQTSEGQNVDLNSVFNQNIEKFITSMIGVDIWAEMKITWRKYSSIYRAATNSLNAISSMFNSIGAVMEVTGENTGKIGNAIRAAGLVRENAYNFMAEKLNVKSSKFMTFQSKVGSVTQVLETVNEIAENIVEGQEQYTEAVKATADFQKQLADAEKNQGIDNKLIKEEADKIKQNISKDPTGEKEEGYLSFLTD